MRRGSDVYITSSYREGSYSDYYYWYSVYTQSREFAFRCAL